MISTETFLHFQNGKFLFGDSALKTKRILPTNERKDDLCIGQLILNIECVK